MEQKRQKIKITDPTRILTVANFISLGRGFMAIPIIYSLQNPEWWMTTLGLIVIAAISDMLDGYFARRAHEVTHIGKWLDPISDSICIASVSFYLILIGLFPVWFFILLFIRYISISIGAIYLINHTNVILSANIPGKWATSLTALFILLKIIPSNAILDLFTLGNLWVTVFLLIISWFLYFKNFIKEFKNI